MSIYRSFGKRLGDVGVAAAVLIVTSPIHAALALVVRVTSGSPVYFVQERTGLSGRPFLLYKFRTMRVGTHEETGGYPTEQHVTRVGRALRASSLDEIPQMLNILKGDMSLVGPRPALPEQAARYSPRQRDRLSVRPGLTGLAQIRYRNNAPWSQRIEADLEYIHSLSFLNDLGILLRTIPAVLMGTSVKAGQTQAEVDDLGLGDVS